MPINTDGAFESIRFTYQHELDETFQLEIEFHHTAMGPTVTIHNLLDSGPLSLPQSVYSDTVDFLRSRGAIPGGVIAKSAVAGPVKAPGRLQPTRMNSYAGLTMTKPVPQTKRTDESDDMQQVYAPQHAILTAGSAIDTHGNSQQRTTPAPVASQVELPRAAPEVEGEDPTNDRDPMFSLAAGKEKRKEGKGDRAPKSLKPAGRVRNASEDMDIDI